MKLPNSVPSPEPTATDGSVQLARDARSALDAALSTVHALHLPGERDRHRERLETAIRWSGEVLDGERAEPRALEDARRTYALAHAARARDARHGAGQLSQSAQRAPTSRDCEQGWQKVERIVANAEASAREAVRVAAMLDDRRVHDAARVALVAAREARRIVDARNHAYTFHADPGFSFGEGWYVAAAAVLAGVRVQVEPDKPQTSQAERFLRDAGLDAQRVPYRSRPRANKALPDLIARTFSEDPRAAQASLRAAFLGGEPVPRAIAEWADRAVSEEPTDRPKVLVWIRDGAHHPTRNSTAHELDALCRLALERAVVPVLIGDAFVGRELPPGALDLTLFWRTPLFIGPDMRRAQLQLFEHLRLRHAVIGQVGVTTAGMDGPALMGLPTVYLTDAPNPRLGTWVGAVPGYEEVVRAQGYLARIGRTLDRWAS